MRTLIASRKANRCLSGHMVLIKHLKDVGDNFSADMLDGITTRVYKTLSQALDLLVETEDMYSHYKLIANDPDCGKWINGVRDLLDIQQEE